MENTTLHNQVTAALQYLAGVCDYASKKDDAGFNAFDAAFGHDLATRTAMGATLTPGQLKAAHKMVYKYRNQLESAGIVLPKPENGIDYTTQTPAPSTSGVKVSLNNTVIEIRFGGKPDEATRTAIKEMKPWRWCPDLPGKPWQVPGKFAQAVIDLLPGAEISPEVAALAQYTPAPTSEPEPDTTSDEPDVVITNRNGHIAISFPNPDGRMDRVAKVKALSERKYDPETKTWIVPTRLATDVVKMFPTAQMDDQVKALVVQQVELRAMAGKAESDIEIENFGVEPYPFQKAGVEFVEKTNGRAIIADQMGLGKTIQALAYLQLHPELRPAVIVCPASLKTNWVREITRCLTTSDKVAVLEGTKPFDPELTGAQIYVINWDILKAWKEALIKMHPAVIIADEAHYAKNSKSQRSKAISEISKAVERVILLTGTPVTNRPAELFPLLNMVDPKAWKNFFQYGIRYCNGHQIQAGRKLVWDFSGASNLDELHNAIAPYVIRRTKDQVLKELPAKVRRTIVVRFDPALRSEYDELIANAEAEAERHNTAQALVFIEAAKQITVKAKLEATIEWLDNFIESNGKLVVFATHHETIDFLMEHYQNIAVKVDGRCTQEQRQDAVDTFQNDPAVKLFVGNIKAAGVGLTLTAASDVIFLEFPWTPGDADQSEDRLHRIGQEDQVTAYYLVGEDTIDETIVALLESKRSVIDTIHDGKPGDLDFSIVGELLNNLKGAK